MSQPTDPTPLQPSEPRPPAGAAPATPPAPANPPAPAEHTDPEGPVRRLRVRRSPKYAAFLVTGAVLGLLVAVVAGLTGPVDPQTGRAKLIGYLAMALVLLGGLLGAGVAVALERFSGRSRLDVRGR